MDSFSLLMKSEVLCMNYGRSSSYDVGSEFGIFYCISSLAVAPLVIMLQIYVSHIRSEWINKITSQFLPLTYQGGCSYIPWRRVGCYQEE